MPALQSLELSQLLSLETKFRKECEKSTDIARPTLENDISITNGHYLYCHLKLYVVSLKCDKKEPM